MASPSPNDLSALLAQYTGYTFTFPCQLPSPCNIPKCERVIYSLEDLAAHEAEHAKSRENICYVCHGSFSSDQALRNHLNARYIKAATHECECGAKYTNPTRRSRCRKSHNSIFRCPVQGCDYRRKRKDLVKLHSTRGHGGSDLHDLVVPTDPVEEPHLDLNPPMPFPGREPAKLRPASRELEDNMHNMQLMCKEYNHQRLAALVKHLLSVGRCDLAAETELLAASIRDGQGSARRTHLRRSASGDARPSPANPLDDQRWPVTWPSLAATPRGQTAQFSLLPGITDNSHISNAAATADLGHEGISNHVFHHGPTLQQSMEPREPESMQTRLQVFSSNSSLGAGQPEFTDDLVADPSSNENSVPADYYRDPSILAEVPGAQYGMDFGQETANSYFPEMYSWV